MKALCPVFLMFFLTVNVSSQAIVNSVVTTGVEVIEKEWRVERHNPLLEENTLRIVDEMNQAEMNRRQLQQRQNTTRSRTIIPPERIPDPIPEPEPESENTEISVRYIYEVKFKNTGEKAIQAIIWDYVFFESGTEKEVGRRRFLSKVNIPAGKTKNLVVRTAFPPTGSINAKNAGKKLRDQFSEQIVIQGIQYADGSQWQAAAAANATALTPTKQIP